MTWLQPTRFVVGLILLWNCITMMAIAQEREEETEVVADSGREPAKTDMNTAPVPVSLNSYVRENPLKRLSSDFLSDQTELWTSPSRVRFPDINWLVPLSGITAGLFVTDAQYSASLSHSKSTISRYNNVSNAGIGLLAGGAGAMWLLSYRYHDDHWRETGFLAGEAAVNSLVMIEAMKYGFGRQRPNQGNGSGDFFNGGTSFPSEHSAAAWAIAGVIAHEYPGTMTKILAYTAATMVSYSRVHSLNHFRSDVVVGALIGNLAASQVYKKRHDVELGGENWETVSDITREASREPSTANFGSPYVPLDSWIYPALERLMAWGYVSTAVLGMRPWTRLQCAQLVSEGVEGLELSGESNRNATLLLKSLSTEFHWEMELGASHDNNAVELKSVYTRVTGISGQPLQDNFYFGQTILNDYGRPYAEGASAIAGFSGWTTSGTLMAYVQGEYQTAGSSPALPLTARTAIASTWGLPVPPATGTPSVSRFELMDSYLGMNVQNWQFSFGKQSLWLGPGDGGPTMFTNNAPPANMFVINRVAPLKFPWIFGYLGPFRMEAFLGQLTGQNFVVRESGRIGQWGQYVNPQPFIEGYKFSFKPFPSIEIGFTGTTVFAGQGMPLTLRSYLNALLPPLHNQNPGQSGQGTDSGDGRSGFDFTARVPKLEKWLTFTFDSFAEDEFSCLNRMEKCAFQAGLYMPQIPGISKLDLRVEGGTTSPIVFPDCVGCFYTNKSYPQSYTNAGMLLGSWIGRASQGEQAVSTYWLTSRNKVQLGYRHRKIDSQYLAGGGTQNDFGVKADIWLGPTVEMIGSVQYERWNIPVLSVKPQTDVTSSVGLTFWPRNWRLPTR